METLTRRQFAKLAGAGAATLSLGGLMCGCENGDSDGVGAIGADESWPSQVVVSMTPGSEPPAGFDPLVSWGCGEHVHEPLIQSTLIVTDADLNFKNDLATSYECSEDGMVWTFKIRDDARFTDGQRLTARDVAFTINGIVDAEASECDLSMVKEAVAIDDTTVKIRMNKPFNALLYTLAVVGIVPEHAYDESYGANPIGSGRYLLEQWDKGQQAILVANPDYYGEIPKMERVVVVFMEEDASLAAAQSGQVDVAYTAATYAANQPMGYDLLVCSSVDSRGISLPCVPAGGSKSDQGGEYAVGNDVTCDLAVRRAINYGVDRERMIENVLNGYGTVAYSVGDGMPWSSPDMRCETDVEKAKRLLDDAGWTVGADGVREREGVRASLSLYYPAGDSVRQAIAAEFADQMEGLGIEVSIKGASWDDLYPHQFTDPVVWGWGTNAPVETYNLLYSEGSANYACYANATVDGYLDEALGKPNVEDSFDLWKKAQWDGTTGAAPQGEAPWVWFANVDHLYFAKENLKVAEQKPHPHGHGWSLVNNVDQWSWA
ncbi:ABC transporter substrate-binding protein [Gordonibacter sp. An230]|uniref:ABC transporter substrate-binding protein n=1 Tax=Gordonibacter sp. An230 TaxID=1965592 RepID=UPI000B373A6C|nr:ABC transporter substrate-binding protein [Gordonibacter sp. An230]OUO89470.1 ABC transporter substrate-binding protein [Gordonibacter sp. An230]